MTDKTSRIQVAVGLFMLAGVVAVSFIALRLGNIDVGNNSYQVIARFTSASGLRPGAYVEAAGVRIGKVSRIDFDTEHYYAVVTLDIKDSVNIQEDAIASVRTAGIIGDKFIKITPGGSAKYLEEGMEIYETEPSINLEELISKYIFEGGE